MGLERKSDRVVITLELRHVWAAAISLAGVAVGLAVFFVVRPYMSPMGTGATHSATADSVSWAEAPRVVVSVEGRPAMGSADAPVTIVEFTDYGCPVCRRHAGEVLPALLDSLGLQIRYVIRHFPIPALTHNAMLAATAAECAHEQGSFWEYRAALVGDSAVFEETMIEAKAAAIGLDRARFRACLRDGAAQEIVQRDLLDAWDYGVIGTPTFFINGRRFRGARSLGALTEYVRLAVLEAEIGPDSDR